MGLDMYAYTINQALVGDDQVDIKTEPLVLEAMGFKKVSTASMEETERNQYWADEAAALAKAKETGVFNSQFGYWRKFNHLHGWMHDLYKRKGGEDPDFNCNTVRLMPEDLDQLEADAASGKMKPRSGFFFGGDELAPEDFEDIFDFVERSRQAIADGKAVIYNSWW